MTTCRMDRELGAYVLRALERDEVAAVERHLPECESCREELRELTATASMLAVLRPEDLDEFEVPNDESVAVRPSRRRALVLVVVATLALATAATTAGVLRAEHPSAQPVAAHAEVGHARASVAMSTVPVATRLHVHVTGVPPSGWCSLVAHSRSGRTDTAATWRADASGTADVTGTTSIPAKRLSELDVVSDTGTVLVRIPMTVTSSPR
jgi:anti-sigma factor RsiW